MYTNLEYTTCVLHNTIIETDGKDHPPMLAPVLETYAIVGKDIKKRIDAKAEVVYIILTGIDNDIYSIVDACPNAKETWKAIERLKQGENINKQDVKTNLYGKFRKFTSKDGESLESYYSRSHAATQSKGKEIDKAHSPPSESNHKIIYKPANNNLRTSSNIRNKNIDNTLRTERRNGYDRKTSQHENQRVVNVAENMDTVGNQVDSAYHKDKMLLCKQLEAWIRLSAEQDDCVYNLVNEPEYQYMKAHYMYMAKIKEVIPSADEYTRPIFDKKPLEKVHPYDDYNVFSNERRYTE
ncbi:hypothetical protein Tco_0144242 [Tanacetum coccineum]